MEINNNLMTMLSPSKIEKKFNPGSYLILSIAITILLFSFADLAYRFTLPTDGWAVNESLAGFNYSRDLMGFNSSLRPGDQVIALEGIQMDLQIVKSSSGLRDILQMGSTVDYTILRGGQEMHVPVTLVNWQLGKWLLATLKDVNGMVQLVSLLILLLIAGFIFFLLPGNPATGSFILIITILVASTISDTLPTGFPVWIDPIANFLQQRVANTILMIITPFALIRFAFVFPHPKPIFRHHPWIPWVIGAVGLVIATVFSDSDAAWFWFVFSFLLTLGVRGIVDRFRHDSTVIFDGNLRII
jgi:hypothetical protein